MATSRKTAVRTTDAALRDACCVMAVAAFGPQITPLLALLALLALLIALALIGFFVAAQADQHASGLIRALP